MLCPPPPRLQFTPVKLLRSMCVVCVLALPGWLVVTVPREVRRKPVFVYVHAALDGGVYRLGFFSVDLGSRSGVLPEQPPNQQCPEARAVLCGLKFIPNVGVREAHLFGDNAVALVHFLRCTASVGRVYQQRLLQCFRYLWASYPGFTVYIHWVRGAVNPADPISKLHDQFVWDLDLAREGATRRVGHLRVSPDRKMVFLWTLGVPIRPFVLPQAWRSGIWTYQGGGGGRTSMRSSCSIS